MFLFLAFFFMKLEMIDVIGSCFGKLINEGHLGNATWGLDNLESITTKIGVFRVIVLWLIIGIWCRSPIIAKLSVVFVASRVGVVETDVDVNTGSSNAKSHSSCDSGEPASLAVGHCPLVDHPCSQFRIPALVPSSRIEVSVLNNNILGGKVNESELKASSSVLNIPCSLKCAF